MTIEPESVGTAPLTSSLKMLRLLDEIARTDAAFGVSEIARRVGGSRSMVHRQLVTLVAAGWLSTNDQGAYTLTFAPVRLGQAALRHSTVDEHITAELRRVAAELGEGISLGMLDGDGITVVNRGLPPRNVHVSLAHGQQFEIEGSALGNVLASYLSDGEKQRLLAAGVALPDEADCAKVRKDGFATLIDDEFDPIEIVAVPVGRTAGNVRFALSAHWPRGRTKPAHVLSSLEASARAIEDLLAQSAGLTAR